MRQHKMTNHKAEMMTVTNGSAQVSPSLKELPGPSVGTIPAPVMASTVQTTVKTTSSQATSIQVAKDGVNSITPQFNAPQQQLQNITLQMSQNSTIPVLNSGTINVTTNGVQVKELNSVLANYVKTKALKTNHNQSPSQSSSSQSESLTQILLPFTQASSSTTTTQLNNANPSVSMPAPAKTIKAPMLQRQLMSPLKPLSNSLSKDLAAVVLPLSSSVEWWFEISVRVVMECWEHI